MAKRRRRDATPPHAARRRLTGLDAVFVHGETETMPMHTMGTMIIDPSTLPSGRFDIDHMRRSMEARIHLMPPWRQRLIEVPFAIDQPMLVDDPDFSIENHLHRAALPSPGSLHELAEFVADQAGRRLDRSRPLWEMWLVEGLEGGRLALVSKLHHCMSDGASGASQMSTLLDLAPDVMPEPPDVEWDPEPLPTRAELLRRALLPSLPQPLALARLVFATSQGMWQRSRAGAELAKRGEEPIDSPVPQTVFGGAISARRSVAFASAPLDAIKFIKNAFGVTVNDAVLAACTLTLRRYLELRGELPSDPLRCAVPVSLKSDEEKKEFSNKVSMMVVTLPTHLEDPVEVVRAIHRETRAAKHVFEAFEQDVMGRWTELAPPALIALGVQAYSALDLADWVDPPMNCLVSNMPGPPVPLYWGGARVDAIFPMGPVGEGVGLNLTVLSNCGRLDLGVMACRDAVPDVWEIAEGFGHAVSELERVARKQSAARESGGEPA
jgi:WS/DGAT/MGAT family acyltransferase